MQRFCTALLSILKQSIPVLKHLGWALEDAGSSQLGEHLRQARLHGLCEGCVGGARQLGLRLLRRRRLRQRTHEGSACCKERCRRMLGRDKTWVPAPASDPQGTLVTVCLLQMHSCSKTDQHKVTAPLRHWSPGSSAKTPVHDIQHACSTSWCPAIAPAAQPRQVCTCAREAAAAPAMPRAAPVHTPRCMPCCGLYGGALACCARCPMCPEHATSMLQC